MPMHESEASAHRTGIVLDVPAVDVEGLALMGVVEGGQAAAVAKGNFFTRPRPSETPGDESAGASPRCAQDVQEAPTASATSCAGHRSGDCCDRDGRCRRPGEVRAEWM